MQTLHLFLALSLLGISMAMAGYVAYCYLTAPATITVNTLKPEDPPITRPATIMDKLAYATKRSATLFLQLATAFVLMVYNGLMNLAEFFNSPELQEFVKAFWSPKVATAVIAGLVLLNVLARMRNS